MKRHMRSASVTVFLLATLALVTTPQNASATLGVPIYWVEGGPNGRLGVVDLDGSGFQVLLTGLNNANGVDIDPFNGHVYWTEGFIGKIRRANLDGSNPIDVLTGLVAPYGLALDLNNSKIFWTNVSNTANNPTVQLANFNGSGVQTLFTGFDAVAIEVDPVGNKIYWSQGVNTNTNTLRRANLDGSSPQTIYTAPVYSGGSAVLEGLTVGYDPNFYPQGRVYFSLRGSLPNNTMESMDLSGGLITTIATDPLYTFVGTDFYDGYKQVIWTNYFSTLNSGKISQGQPDGSLSSLISTVGLNRAVNDVAIWPFLPPVPEPATAILLGTALAFIATIARHRRRIA
jgi:hypothetical protein